MPRPAPAHGLLAVLFLAACDDAGTSAERDAGLKPRDAATPLDQAPPDQGAADAAPPDARPPDAAHFDARAADTSVPDSAIDGATPDARSSDALAPDSARPDAAPPDAALTCSTPNPAGCLQTGCPGDLECRALQGQCHPSACACDPDSDTWDCTADCGGGSCVPPGPQECPGDNPQGCLEAGCPGGGRCIFDQDGCVPSHCECEADLGLWVCTEDCGGGVCVGGNELRWYLTCGDPVCEGHREDPDVPPCADDVFAGRPCADADARCDPGDPCNARLLCDDHDPREDAPCPR